MAVRWGAGEETLTACNMDIFPLDKLLETTGLHTGDPLDTLQGCLDTSILSIFEDTPTIETRGLEDESDATLLTALTEILDNVDDENLSPFDTLPESDLLSGQKGREHSPLRRLCLSHSPPAKDTLCGAKPQSTGKTLPKIQLRSDGEEEEDSLTPSPGRLELSSDNELLDWEGFPITFEQGGEDEVSVSLGDLVRHMHPYCMAISLEDDKGEKMLPEGGILLEVVDQGENGDPILAIPMMNHPISEKLNEPFSNPNVFYEADNFASDSTEHIVVDDEDTFVPTLRKDAENETYLNVKDKTTSEKPKNKSPSRRKRKNKSSNSPAACPHEPTEGRVLRRAALKMAAQKPQIKADNKSHKEDKNNPTQDSAATTTATLFTKPKNITLNQTERRSENTTTLPLIPVSSRQDTVLTNTSAEMGQSSCPPKAEGAQQPKTMLNLSAPSPEKQESSVAGLTASKACQVASCTAVLSQSTLVVSEISDPLPTVTAEPKPKSLSLAEYRRLRQQKKPTPMEKHDDNSTKWPSLPELPKELLPIPYLPIPSPKDPRRSQPQSAKHMEVKAAWQPRGPGAPPTPEALLAPPAYMVTSSHKVAAATNVPKPPQTPHQTAPTQHTNSTSDAAPILHTEQATTGDEGVTEGPLSHPTSATISTDAIKPSADVSPPTVSIKTAAKDASKHIDSCGKGGSSAHHLKSPSQGEAGISERKSSAANPVEAKNPTQELIEAFTTEMGIEATDLTSLLEQFEETQAKEEQSVPEVSGRAAAVGNFSTELVLEKMVVERVRANLSRTTALTPPATPPHLWKPLAPVSLLGKSKIAETTKSGLSKVIEIEAQPLPSAKSHCKFTYAAGSVAPDLACKDHDYCLPNKGTSSGEAGMRWNVKQHSSITIKSIKQPATQALHHPQTPTVQAATTCAAKAQDYPPTKLGLKIDNLEKSSVLETPDASPTHEDADTITSPRRGPFGRSYRQSAASCTPSPKERSGGRSRLRRSRCSSSRSISSDSHSSRSRTRSYSPPQKRYRPCRSTSSSSSSSRSSSRSSSQSSCTSLPLSPQRRRRYSYSSSRSGSWSRSRSRSPSLPTQEQWSRRKQLSSPSYKDSYGTSVKTNHEVKRYKEKAIEERRVVYVGRIRGTMTQKELKERFSYFGEIEECTLHFRDHGDNYGFVTYYNTNDAFMAIENGSRLRKPDELPFDLCFGGRRQFCQTSYADLDSNKEYEPLTSRKKNHALDFDTLLKQAQQNLKR